MVKTVLRPLSFSLLIAMLLLSICVGFTGTSNVPSAHAASHSQNAVNGVQWPSNQALPRFSNPHHLDAVDLENEPGDIGLMMSTLEGIVNRTQPRIYLIESIHDEGPYTWLNDSHIPYQLHQNPWEIVSKYYHEAKGIIIYDPNMTDSIDVATTLAGLKDGIVVSPTLAQTLMAAPYHMPVLDDLRGKFSSALDAYTWEFQNLWPLTTHRMLIGLKPTTSITVPPNNWKDFQTVLQENNPVTDGSNRKTYNIDLSNFLGGNAVYLRFQDAFPNDGWGPSVHQVTVTADGNVIAQFTGCSQQEEQYIFDHGNSQCALGQDQHRFADGKNYFVYRFVPPAGTKQLTVSVDMLNEFLVSASKVAPAASSDQQVPFGYLRDYAVANHAFVFWLTAYTDPNQVALFNKILASVKPGTPYLGWFDDEPNGVTMASQHGVSVLAADWISNLTVWSGVPAPSLKIKPMPAPKLQNKIYVTFVVSDGDNLQYDEHYMRVLWNDPARGKVPLNWSIQPLLIDAAPFFLHYYQQTATPNDLLIAAPSGAGYFYPSQWPQDNLPTYLQQSNKYLHAMGTNIIYALDDSSPTMSASVGQAYAQTGITGMFYNNYSQSNLSIVNGNLPVSPQLSVGSDDGTIINAIHQQAANWDGKSPLFITVSLVAWNTTATDGLYIAQHLGNNYSVVRGDQYFQLVREANNLPPVK